MNNALKQITLPLTGQIVEVRAWITAGQALHARAALLEQAVFEQQGDEVKLAGNGFKGNALTENKIRTLEAYVATIGGQNENIRQLITDLPEEDYDFLAAFIDEHRSESQKKKSSTNHQP